MKALLPLILAAALQAKAENSFEVFKLPEEFTLANETAACNYNSGDSEVDRLRELMHDRRIAMRKKMMPPKPTRRTVGGATWDYRVNGDFVSIEGAAYPNEEELLVPGEFEGKKVKTLNAYLFVPVDHPVKKIILPASLKQIGEKGFNPFRNMMHLTEIAFAAENEAYATYDGALYTKDFSELIAVPIAKKKIGFPNGVKVIRNGAFANSKIEGSLKLPDTVEAIGDAAFMGCDRLTRLDYPKGAKLGKMAISHCRVLNRDTTELSTPHGFIDDLDLAIERAKATGKRIYAVFTGSDWCPACKELESRLLSRPDFVDELSKNFVLVYLDMPRNKYRVSEKARDVNRPLSRKYKVVGLPGIVIMNSEGEFLRFADRGLPGETPRMIARRISAE